MDRRSFLQLSALLPFSILSVKKAEVKLDNLYIITVPKYISPNQQMQLIRAMHQLNMRGMIIPEGISVEEIPKKELARLLKK